MVFGALPQEILCACTKESAFARLKAVYTAPMSSVNDPGNSNPKEALDVLAEEFLDLWQDNIRLWAEERDLFTLQNFIEMLKTHQADQYTEAADE